MKRKKIIRKLEKELNNLIMIQNQPSTTLNVVRELDSQRRYMQRVIKLLRKKK